MITRANCQLARLSFDEPKAMANIAEMTVEMIGPKFGIASQTAAARAFRNEKRSPVSHPMSQLRMKINRVTRN